MSASPQRFTFVPQTTAPEALFQPATPSRQSDVSAQTEGAVNAVNQTRLYTTLAIVLTLAGGILAGYFLYLLWEQVGLHDTQIARQQVALDKLTANGAAVSNQVGRLKAIDRDVDSIKALLQLQSKKVAELERGQNGIHDQMVGMNARWQRAFRDLSKAKSATPTAPSSPAPAPPAPVANNAATQQVATPPPPALAPQTPAEKHNETFSPDLKPAPNAYAQMSPNGLVIWMTPRPGFSKPVPTSVIGHVRGLGMLVHDWDDNNHYFITESGSWMLDQR
jgi:hypothetical protein